MRKSIIVYYSWYGNTEVVATELNRQTQYPMEKLEEVNKRKPKTYVKATIEAVFGYRTKLKPFQMDMHQYGHIFLGTQVWANHFSPAVKSFIKKVDLKHKKVYMFITKADDSVPESALRRMRRRIKRKGGQLMDVMILKTKWTPSQFDLIKFEDVKDKIRNWIEKNQLSTL